MKTSQLIEEAIIAAAPHDHAWLREKINNAIKSGQDLEQMAAKIVNEQEPCGLDATSAEIEHWNTYASRVSTAFRELANHIVESQA